MPLEIQLPEKQYMRVDEVANLACRSKRTVYRWCRDGKIDFVRVGDWGMLIPTTAVCQVIRLSSDCYETE